MGGNLVPDGIGYIDDNSTTPNNFYLSTTYPMWSVEKLTPVDYDPTQDQNLPPVYKLFSSRQLKDAELSSMFSDIEFVSVTNCWRTPPTRFLMTSPTSRSPLACFTPAGLSGQLLPWKCL